MILRRRNWTYEPSAYQERKRRKSHRGGGYLLQAFGSSHARCDFTRLDAHDEVFQVETFLRKHMYDRHLTYIDGTLPGKTARGSFNQVDLKSCGNRPYVLRRLMNHKATEKKDHKTTGKKDVDPLWHTLSPHYGNSAIEASELAEYLQELKWQAYLSKYALAPQVYMVGRLMRDKDFFELFCMMEPKTPLSEKEELTRSDLDLIKMLYKAIARSIPGVTFVDVKVENLVYSTYGFQAIDFGVDFAILDDSVPHHVRGGIMCYLFYMHTLSFWLHRMTEDTKGIVQQRVHELLRERPVVETMRRWYHSEDKEPFRRIVNCYSFQCCEYNEKTQPFLDKLYNQSTITKEDVLALPPDSAQRAVRDLLANQLSFLWPLAQHELRKTWSEWKEEKTVEHDNQGDAMDHAAEESNRAAEGTERSDHDDQGNAMDVAAPQHHDHDHDHDDKGNAMDVAAPQHHDHDKNGAMSVVKRRQPRSSRKKAIRSRFVVKAKAPVKTPTRKRKHPQ